MFELRVLTKILLSSTSSTCALLIAACSPGNNVLPVGADPAKVPTEDNVEKTSRSAPQKNLKMPSTVNAKFNEQGEISTKISDIAISIKAHGCTEEGSGIMLCNRSPVVEVKFRGGKSIVVEPEALYLDSNATLYHGPLDESYKKNRHSIILTDVNGDGHEDLVVWSGKEGNYGGPSYSVYLFNAAQQRLIFNQSLSDITVMANGLFSVKGNMLTSTSGDGCCIHVLDTYELKKDEVVLVERLTEDTNDPANPKKRTERLQNGEMKEVNN
ncbi:FG-GAP repeat protein [Xanthomonas fragariae]|uniref:FG-GAP repeat protein n=1 Tax=Xanthomonas fragariae TaxID=48664 RepID=UPI0022AAEA2C|nr:FG-GAP repeat protein [Xanthomonas fragariae]WAT16154.1 FG-GAP repeat protein [Xanthomonas fragariae]